MTDLRVVERCPLCDASAADAVVLLPARDGLGVVRCPACLLAYATAVRERPPPPAETAVEPARPHAPRPGAERARARLRLYDRLARGRIARPHPGARALDLACGPGLRLDALRDLGYATEGIELAAPGPARAAGHRVHQLDLDLDLADLDLGRRYDLILLIDALAAAARPLGLLAFVRRHLAPGGLAVVEVPNFDDPARHLWRGRYRPLDLGRRRLFFDRPALDRALDRAGLRRLELWSAPEASTILLPTALTALGRARALLRRPPPDPSASPAPARPERLARLDPLLRALDRLNPAIEEAVGPECPWGASLVAIAAASERP